MYMLSFNSQGFVPSSLPKGSVMVGRKNRDEQRDEHRDEQRDEHRVTLVYMLRVGDFSVYLLSRLLQGRRNLMQEVNKHG